MKLFDKWQSVTEAYESFNREYKILMEDLMIKKRKHNNPRFRGRFLNLVLNEIA